MPSASMPPVKSSHALDVLAMGLSGLCLAHCLLMPALIIALPMLGFLSDEHWVHQLLIGMAMPVSLFAILRSGNWLKPLVILPMLVGLGLLGSAAFYEPLEVYEVPLSVTGALLLAFGHFHNARLNHKKRHRTKGLTDA